MPRYRPGLCLGGASVLGFGESSAGGRQDSSAAPAVTSSFATAPSLTTPSWHLPRHPNALYARMEQNRGCRSASLCLVPPALVPSEKAETASLCPKYRPTAEHGPRQVRSENVHGNRWWPIKSKVTRRMDMASAYRFTSWIRWSWFWGSKEAVSLHSPRRQRKCYFYCFWHGILLEQKLAASLENICSFSRSQKQIHFLMRCMDRAPQRLSSKWDFSFSTYKNEHLLKF